MARSSGLDAAAAAAAAVDVRARDARELHRQQAWRDEAARALNALHEDEGTRPVNAAQLEVGRGGAHRGDGAGRGRLRRRGGRGRFGDAALTVDEGSLPTLRVFPHGVTRKRLEQAIRDLQLPVIIAREPDEADVVDDAPNGVPAEAAALREAEDRGAADLRPQGEHDRRRCRRR